MRHHTKDKGDIGLGLVISDLLSNGIQVCLPISEHLPFDLIAVSDSMQLMKIQVKYRKSVKSTGSIQLHLSNPVVTNGKSKGRKAHDFSEIDAYAICSPDTGKVYYVKISEIEATAKHFSLRLKPPKNNQSKGIRLAEDYEGANRLFIEN